MYLYTLYLLGSGQVRSAIGSVGVLSSLPVLVIIGWEGVGGLFHRVAVVHGREKGLAGTAQPQHDFSDTSRVVR
jgi:hypothetical protein